MTSLLYSRICVLQHITVDPIIVFTGPVAMYSLGVGGVQLVRWKRSVYRGIFMSEASDLKVAGKIIVDEINKWCNVRSGPGMEYTIIGKANKNDTYSVYGVVEDWYQIDYNGSVGYLYGDLASEVLPGNV